MPSSDFLGFAKAFICEHQIKNGLPYLQFVQLNYTYQTFFKLGIGLRMRYFVQYDCTKWKEINLA